MDKLVDSAVFELTSDGLCLVGPDDRVLVANSRWLRSLGLASDQVLGQRIFDLPPVLQRVPPGLYLQAKAGSTLDIPRFAHGQNGRTTWHEGSIGPVPAAAGAGTAMVLREVQVPAPSEPGHLETDEMFKLIASHSPDAVFYQDLDLRYVWAVAPPGPFSTMAIVGRTDFDLHPSGPAEMMVPKKRQVLQTGIGIQFESPMVIDGIERHYDIVFEPSRDQGGQVAGLLVYIRDITKRRQAELALAASRDYYLTILEDFPALIWRSGLDARCDYFNKTWLAFTGRTMEQELGDGWVEGVHPDDRESCAGSYLRAFGDRRPFQLEYRLRRFDGQYRWIIDAGRPIRGLDGQFAGFVGACWDITEEKETTERLRESEARYREMADSLPLPIFETDRAGHLTFINRAGIEQFGIGQENVAAGAEVFQALSPTDRDRARASFGEIMEGKSPRPWEYRLLRANGQVFPGIGRSTPIVRSGEVIGLRGYVMDISERRQAVEALMASETRFKMAAELASDLIYEWSLSSGTVEFHGDVDSRLGYPLGGADRTRAGWLGYIHPEDRDRVGSAVETTRASWRIFEEAYRIRAKDGTYRLWLDRGCLTYDDAGEPTRWVGVVTDITEQKAAEAQIERQLLRISVLRNIENVVASSLDLRVSLEGLLDQITNHLGIHAADVLLLNPHSLMLEYSAGKGFRTKAMARSRLRLGEGHAGQAAIERRVVGIANLPCLGESFVRASLLKGESFVSYYAVPMIAKGQVKGVLEVFHRNHQPPDPDWLDFLETLSGQAAIAIENATLFTDLQASNTELLLAYDATIEAWARVLDLRDSETEGHSRRVAEMTLHLARAVGLSEQALVNVRRGALLHDIGKMALPDTILRKPGPLDDGEWEIMRMHPVYAFSMLSPIDHLKAALDIPYCHHEKWDGSGYPRRLRGEEIPIEARLFALVDVYDALRSDRPYRKAWSETDALDHIRSLAGSHFDPALTKVFLGVDWDSTAP